MSRRKSIETVRAQDRFLTGLQVWVESAETKERESRTLAMEIIIEARRNRSTGLLLQELGLSSLPAQIGELTDLTDLNLDRNQLTTLPREIANLASLTTLDLTASTQLTHSPELLDILSELETKGCNI